jgi:HSP20 family molecular chaperone IbpA
MITNHDRRGVTVEETELRFIVTLDLSGFTRPELSVELAGQVVTVRAAHRSSSSVHEESVRLPEHVDTDHVLVYFDCGLVEIHAPKRGAAARPLAVLRKPRGLLRAEAGLHDHVPVGLGVD